MEVPGIEPATSWLEVRHVDSYNNENNNNNNKKNKSLAYSYQTNDICEFYILNYNNNNNNNNINNSNNMWLTAPKGAKPVN